MATRYNYVISEQLNVITLWFSILAMTVMIISIKTIIAVIKTTNVTTAT